MSKRVVPQRFFEYKALFEGAMAQIEQAPAIEGMLKIQYENLHHNLFKVWKMKE